MVASKFLNPRNDLSFKKLFGSEKNKDILIHFLNDMLTDKKGDVSQGGGPHDNRVY